MFVLIITNWQSGKFQLGHFYNNFLAKEPGNFYWAVQRKLSPPSCFSLYIKLFQGNATHVDMTLGEKKKTIRKK